MLLRPFSMDTDFDTIKGWIADERMHAMWCANLIAFPLGKENFCQVLENFGNRFGDLPLVMAADDGKPAGFFCYSMNTATNEGKLKFVVLDPALRGKGMGKTMLKLAVEYAFSATKAEAVRLSVFPENIPAMKCYESVGFVPERTETGAFRFRDELWSRCSMAVWKDTAVLCETKGGRS